MFPDFTTNTRMSPYTVFYLNIGLIVVVLGAILLIQPKLDKDAGWTGLRVRPAYAGGTPVVEEVVPGSPAWNVGIVPGDTVVSFNDVTVRDVKTLQRLVKDSYVNQLVRIVVERNGKQLVADTRIAERPQNIESLVSPPISIVAGTAPPHADRGLCINCHNIMPPAR